MNLIENVELDNIVSAKSQIQILSQIKSTTELKNRISTTKIYSMSGEFLRYTVYKYGKTFTEGVVEEYAPNGEVLTINEIKDGVLNGEAKFYEGSKLRGIAHYKNNIPLTSGPRFPRHSWDHCNWLYNGKPSESVLFLILFSTLFHPPRSIPT